jgi:hypothetical protein
MKKVKTTNRMPLKVGATITLSFILIAFMCVAAHFGMNTRSKADIKGDDVCTTTTITSTGMTSTTSSTTTSTKTSTATTTQTTTTSTTTVTNVPESIQVIETEPVTEAPAPEPQSEPQPAPDPEPQPEGEIGSAEVICKYSENDAVLLAQLINKEASATWEGKIAVGNCVINRANANGISISSVIYAPGQFTTAYSLGYYTDTDYQAAVQVLTYGSSDTRIYYFDGCHSDCKNWFYDSYHNYLYAA